MRHYHLVRNNGWAYFNRLCPVCGKNIPKYAHRCPNCRVPIKNHLGKVYAK